MDWNQTKSIAEADLGVIIGKVSSPRAALGSLEKKITAEVAKIEAYLESLDGRALDLPGLLDQADQKVAKIQAVIAKADNDGRPDLKQAASVRLAKDEADRKALQDELDGLDQVQTVADEWLTKLQDKLIELQTRLEQLPSDPKPQVASPGPATDALASAPPPAATPKPAPAPAKAAPAKAGGKKDALDDEFAALFAELNVDPSQIELPKKKVPAKIEVDDKIPDLVSVRDDELPEGEELPPLEIPKKGAGAAVAKAGAAGAGAAVAKAGSAGAAVAKAGAAGAGAAVKAAAASSKAAAVPAKAPAKVEAKGSKAWLWWTTGVVVLGGGGAAVAHFVFGVF